MAQNMNRIEWREGEWQGKRPVERPVEPEGYDYAWFYVDWECARPQPQEVHGSDFMLRTHLAYMRQEDSECDPPRWWWAPLEEPDNLPEECKRSRADRCGRRKR